MKVNSDKLLSTVRFSSQQLQSEKKADAYRRCRVEVAHVTIDASETLSTRQIWQVFF